MRRPKIAVTLGDPRGIGPEVAIRALRDLSAPDAEFVLVGPEGLEETHGLELVSIGLWSTDGGAREAGRLSAAAIERASGLVACVSSDKDNLIATVSARMLRPDLRIVCRCKDEKVEQKIRNAGADAVVLPSQIGGLRMISELVRPTVTGFLDIMLREKSKVIRFEEAVIGEGSEIGGKKIEEANIQERTGLAVVAVRRGDEGDYTYSPKGNFKLDIGDTLIVLGDVGNLPALNKLTIF